MSEMSDRIRHDFKASDDVRDKGLTTPANVIRYDDIVYGDSLKWQSLDVYRPKEAGDKNLPVIVMADQSGKFFGQGFCCPLHQVVLLILQILNFQSNIPAHGLAKKGFPLQAGDVHGGDFDILVNLLCMGDNPVLISRLNPAVCKAFQVFHGQVCSVLHFFLLI